jgi:hypothetical protein
MGRYATQLGATAATMGAGGPFLYAADVAMNAVHGNSWTPEKYKTLSLEARNQYLNDPGMAEVRAQDLSPMSSDLPGGNATDQRLVEYLQNVQPYDQMEYFNPRTLAGKQRAYAQTRWAKGRIGGRWKKDMDAIEAQELADKYGLEMPEDYKGSSYFKADYSKGY